MGFMGFIKILHLDSFSNILNDYLKQINEEKKEKVNWWNFSVIDIKWPPKL